MAELNNHLLILFANVSSYFIKGKGVIALDNLADEGIMCLFFLSRSVRGLFPNFECEVETGLTSLGAEGASPWPQGTEANLAWKFQYCSIGCGLYY